MHVPKEPNHQKSNQLEANRHGKRQLPKRSRLVEKQVNVHFQILQLWVCNLQRNLRVQEENGDFQ